MGQRYFRLEDEKQWPVLARNHDIANGRGHNTKVKSAIV